MKPTSEAARPDGISAPLRDLRLEQAAHRDWSATAGGEWLDADAIWTHLSQNTNQTRAAMEIDWRAFCCPGCTVLDLGCGSGWLTAILARRNDVARVLAWDASPVLLGQVLPRMISLLDGDP